MDVNDELVVECDDGFVHTTVRAVAGIEWFRVMLSSGFREASERVVRLEGYRKRALELLVKGNAAADRLSLEDAAIVLPLAHYLNVTAVADRAKQLVTQASTVDASNFGCLFALAEQMDMQELRNKCLTTWYMKYGGATLECGHVFQGNLSYSARGEPQGVYCGPCFRGYCPFGCVSVSRASVNYCTNASCNLSSKELPFLRKETTKQRLAGADEFLISLARCEVSLLDELNQGTIIPRPARMWTSLLMAPADLWTLNDRQLVEVFALPPGDLLSCMQGSNLSHDLLRALLAREMVQGPTATAMLALCLEPQLGFCDVARTLILEHGASIDKPSHRLD